MSISEQPCYTLINFPTDSEPYNEMQLKHDLEKGDTKKKTEALKKVIGILLNGERIPGLLMIIIRFVLPLQDHTIKKLLLIFWEIVPKTAPDGKLLQEMILVCDAYRKDLQHPNEFIRGSTLRFLCKLKEPELLEPLMPSIRACLDHRHSYVRRNAVLAIFTIYRNFEFLIPDAPELVANFLENEQDMSCKRNAFLMLLHVDQERALAYLSSRLDSVPTFGDILQLVIVELIYKVCVSNPSERARFIRCVYSLVADAASSAVRYEAAGTLTTLSHAPHAIQAAAACYLQLLGAESDNNVKLIVLSRLGALRTLAGSPPAAPARRALAALALDLLAALQAPDLDVRRATLSLVLKLVSARDAEALVAALRREAARAHCALSDSAPQYRQLLVQAMHRASLKFPEVAGAVGPALIELVGEGCEPAARDVMLLLREHLHTYPHLQPVIYEKLLEAVRGIKDPGCARGAIWLLAQFADNSERVDSLLELFEKALGDDSIQDDNAAQSSVAEAPRQLVTSDGTYASQSAFNLPQSSNSASTSPYDNMRNVLMANEPFTASSACSALTKLALKGDTKTKNRVLTLIATLMAKRQATGKEALTADDLEHMWCCVAASAPPKGSPAPPALSDALVTAPAAALAALLAAPKHNEEEEEDEATIKKVVDVEAPIIFPQLSAAGANNNNLDIFELALSKAVDGRSGLNLERTGLSSVRQLTGFSDPVYAEAIVSVNQYDILLDVLLLNQTDDTLQNCCVELATLGDLRLVERPAPVVLAPRDYATIKAHVKVASTENGVIFGNIVYEVSGGGERGGVVVLNDVHIDIVEYIAPARCSDADFRRMWADFEWENKVSVNTNITDLKEYLDHLLASTNMKCLTPEKALSGQCGFMAANMYARSVFGEDALANLSVEKPPARPGAPPAPVVGHVRIRAKSQGMALSLGDKINSMQKATIKPNSPAIPAA